MNYIGRKVTHKKFGKGIVLEQKKDFLCINFFDCGQKNILFSGDSTCSYIEFYDEALLQHLKSFRFEGFHHYTDFSNLNSVFNEGFLYSRELSMQKNIPFWNSSEIQIVNKTRAGITDHVRFYYKEGTPTLYQNEGIKNSDFMKRDSYSAHMPIPVLLLFDESLLFEDGVKISNGGCGNSFSDITEDFECAKNFDWIDIFSRAPFRNDNIFYECDKREKINKRNAEFLVPNKVSLEYLKTIFFRSEADKKHADFILSNNPIYQKAKKYTKIEKFHTNKNEINFLEDYTVNKNNNTYNISLYFNKNPLNYQNEFRVFYVNGRTDVFTLDMDSSFKKDFHYSLDIFDDVHYIEYTMDGYVCAIWR